jgi:hypothetical protein
LLGLDINTDTSSSQGLYLGSHKGGDVQNLLKLSEGPADPHHLLAAPTAKEEMSLLEARNPGSEEKKYSRQLEEQEKKMGELEERVQEQEETIEILNCELEEMVGENMELKEKYSALRRSGLGVIQAYHKELYKAHLAIESAFLNSQRRAIQEDQARLEMDNIRDYFAMIGHSIAELETDPRLPIQLQSFDSFVGLKENTPIVSFMSGIVQNLSRLLQRVGTLGSGKNGQFGIELQVNPQLLNLCRSVELFESCQELDLEVGNNAGLETVLHVMDKTKFEDVHGYYNTDNSFIFSEESLALKPEDNFRIDMIQLKEENRYTEDLKEIIAQFKRSLDQMSMSHEKLQKRNEAMQEHVEKFKAETKKAFEVKRIELIEHYNKELSLKELEVKSESDKSAELEGIIKGLKVRICELVGWCDEGGRKCSERWHFGEEC